MYNSKADRMKACDKKFEVLFGKKPNSGEGNDPELYQILQKFIYGIITGTIRNGIRSIGAVSGNIFLIPAGF